MIERLKQEVFLPYFQQAEKDPSQFKVGLEQELLGFVQSTHRRITYKEHILPILQGFADCCGWEPYYEGDNLIALKRNGCSITLEPGGQLELSLKPFASLSEISQALTDYQSQLHKLSKDLGIVWLSMGYDPLSAPDQVPFVPKRRYQVMGDYLPPLGAGAHHMMKLTATAQSNLDFSSEQDMAAKMLVTTALSPLVSTLFATSPFRLGGFSGYKSMRNWTWRAMDPSRCGYLDFVFDEGFNYSRYIDYILDVPMLVLERKQGTLDFHGESFRTFCQKGRQGVRFEPRDWQVQMGCTFPVARLRNAIETRTADAGPLSHLLGQAAFWKGLLYDPISLEQTTALIRSRGSEFFKNLHVSSYVEGFDALNHESERMNLFEAVLDMAAAGLARLDQAQTQQDAVYLLPIRQIFQKRQALSDQMIERFLQGRPQDLFSLLGEFDLIFA